MFGADANKTTSVQYQAGPDLRLYNGHTSKLAANSRSQAVLENVMNIEAAWGP